MIALLVLAASLADTPTVAVLPLRAKPGVTAKQAAGTTALLREAAGQADFLRLVPERKQDDKDADKCRDDGACLATAAFQRGADLLAAGTIAPAPDGLKIVLVVVSPKSEEPVRTVGAVLAGDPAPVFDRLMRQAFAPETLAGALLVEGDCEGASILVDGKDAGTCPREGPILGLVEGPHVVEATKPGFQKFRRVVDVAYKQIASVKITLLRDLPA